MPRQQAAADDTRLAFLQDFAHRLNAGQIELPPFPDAYARILSALENPDLSMAQVAKVIAGSPDLCVRVLRMANSALLNRSGIEVTDLGVAVSRLGVAAVRNAAVSLATQEAFPIPKDSPRYQELASLHEAAVKTAAWAYALARRARLGTLSDNAMLTGLLHNVGSFYLLTRVDDFPEFGDPETARSWGPGVGSAIISNWGFPDEIAKAVEDQDVTDNCQPGKANLHDLLVVSKRMAAIPDSDEGRNAAVESWEGSPAFCKLGISHLNLSSVMDETREEVASFLGAFH